MNRTVKRRRKSILNHSPKSRQDTLQEGSESVDASIKMHDNLLIHPKDDTKESDSLNKPSQSMINTQLNSQEKQNFTDNSISNHENIPAFTDKYNHHESKGTALPSAARILSSLVMQGSSLMSKEKGHFSNSRATTASLDKQKHSWRHQPIDSTAICNQLKNAHSSTYNQANINLKSTNLYSCSYNPSLNGSLYQSHNTSCHVSQNESNFTTIMNSEREDNLKDNENSNWSRKLNQNDFNQISNLLGVQKARSLRNQNNHNGGNDINRNAMKPLKVTPVTGNVSSSVYPTTASTSPEQKQKGYNFKKYQREKDEEGRDISQENIQNQQYYSEHLRQSCFPGSFNHPGQQQNGQQLQRNQQFILSAEGYICIGRKNSIQQTNKMSLFESLLMRKHKQLQSINNSNNGNKISIPNNSITHNKTTNQSTLCSSRFYQSLLAKEASNNNNQSNKYIHTQQNGSAQLVINMKKIVPYREHKLKQTLPLTRLHTNPDRQQDSTKIVNAVVASNSCCQSTPRLQGIQNNINICNDNTGTQIIPEHSDTPRNNQNNGSYYGNNSNYSNLLKRQALVESFTSNVIQSFRNRGYVKTRDASRGLSNESNILDKCRQIGNVGNPIDSLSLLANSTCSINENNYNNRNKSRMIGIDSKNESQQSSETANRIIEKRPKTTEIPRRDLGKTQQNFGLLIQSQRTRVRQSINVVQENQKHQSQFTRSQPFEDNQLTTSSGSVIGMHTSSNLLEISTDESIQAKQASNYVAELARKQITRSIVGIEYGPWCQDEDEEQIQQQQQFKGKFHALNVIL